jgi:hypothetical protein
MRGGCAEILESGRYAAMTSLSFLVMPTALKRGRQGGSMRAVVIAVARNAGRERRRGGKTERTGKTLPEAHETVLVRTPALHRPHFK